MKTALFAAFMVVSTGAQALLCEVKEYAQYKDQASYDAGRQQIGMDYCFAKKMFDLGMKNGGGFIRETQACGTAMSKMLDALGAAGQSEFAKDMANHCDDKYGVEAVARRLQAEKAPKTNQPPK